jgi:CTP:molybdopterin cytidylyltransferase MocA
VIAAIILAAGYSSRMGEPKALLKIENTTFLESILTKVSDLCPNLIYVVLGQQFEKIKKSIQSADSYDFIHNKNPELGQLSSLQKALIDLPRSISGFLMILVDHPLVSPQTYFQIYEKAIQNPDVIIIPVYKSHKGHPVYFGSKYINELLRAPLGQGARYVVNKNSSDVVELSVEDEGILIDIDTPETYQKFISTR